MRKHKNQPNWKPSRWSSICNKHFLPTDFKVQKGLLRKHLKSDAVPTIEVPHTPIDNEKLPPPSAIPVAPTSTLLTLSEAITNVTLPLDRSSIGTQCRLCTQIIYNEGVNIFNCRSLQEWTSKHLPRLNILPDDCLPKCICPSCFHQLEQFDRFSETAIQSQNSFCAELAATVPSSTSNSLFRNSFDSPRVIKIKQEPIVSIKEETHLLNTATEQQQQHSEEFETNLSSLLLSDFYQYGLGSGGHIMEITDLTNDFINLTEDDNNVAEGMHQEINIKPNILALRNNSVAGGSGTLHLKQEDGLVIDDFCDEDDLSKAMISNEHSYCKFNLPQFLDGNALRLIKTEKKEEHAAMPTAPPNHTSVAQIPLVTVPKIYIIDNALLKHNCDRCGDMFETRAMLLDHQRRVHHDRFLCGLCKTRFLNFSAFYFHKLNCAYRRGYLTTAGRRKYWQCTQCKMFFRLQLGFKNHVKRQICRKLLRIRRYHQQWSKKIDQVGEMRYTGNRVKTVGAAISKQVSQVHMYMTLALTFAGREWRLN